MRVGKFSEEILFVIFHPMTNHKCKVLTQSLFNFHSFFKSEFVCANVLLHCMIWRRRSEQQLTTVIASHSAVFFSPMSLFLLLLTCTSFLHVCLWYSFVMIKRRTSGQLSVKIVRVNTSLLLREEIYFFKNANVLNF